MRIEKGLMKGSFVLLIAFGLFNLFNLLFQVSMVRMLNVVDYGTLAALFSVSYMFGIFTESIQTVITKYTSTEANSGRIKNILRKSLKKSFVLSILFFILYLIVSIPLTFILDVDYLLLAFNGLFIFSAFLMPITKGVLQGRKMFFGLGANLVLEALSKLLLSILLVYAGWRVYGALAGTFIAFVIAFILCFVQLRKIMKSKEGKSKTEGIYVYARPAFVITTVILIFYTIDIFIAKIVFSPELAGKYAMAAVLSKSIFWGTLPVAKAMFPLSSDNHSKKRRSGNLFLNAFLLVMFLVIVALFLFYFFPDQIVYLFRGSVIPESAKILFLLGLAISLTSVANLILLYKLSLGRVGGHRYLLGFLLLEVALFFYFSTSLWEFSISFVISSVVLLVGSIILLKE
ncbi:MAG: oligosaccharide flippase family protein [archaeon]